MATIDPHAFFSSPNHSADPHEPSSASASAYLNACEGLHIKLIRALPKQKAASDPFFLALGLRQTLKALVEYQCQSECVYDPHVGIAISVSELAEFNCYTESATKGHLKALAQAGWVSITDSSTPGELACKLSVALELYGELTRLAATTGGLPDSRCEQLRADITALLACNQSEYKALQQAKQRSRLLARGTTGAKIIELAIKIAERDRAGLGIAYQLREQIGMCQEFLSTPATTASPGTPIPQASAAAAVAAEEIPAMPQASGLSCPPAPEGIDQADDAANGKPALSLAELSNKNSSAQLAVKLRNELLSLACHIDKERLVPEVLAFTRSEPPLAELEKKVRAFKLLKRSAHLPRT